MAASSKRKVDTKKCSIWIYGPQVSEKNAFYSVGGDTWENIYIQCSRSIEKIYFPGLTPKIILEHIFFGVDRSEELKQNVLQTLKESKDILDVLVIHSAFINALGMDIIYKTRVIPEVQETMAYRAERIATVYKYLYEETEKILVDKDTLKIFVTPDQFKQLGNSQAGRPRNIALAYDKQDIVKNYKIVKKCEIGLNTDCAALFESIKADQIFRPLVDDIVCHCSFFKQKLEKSPSTETTFFINPEMTNIISKGDYDYIKHSHRGSIVVEQKPVLIKKYSNTAETSDKKTYLSQLFQKCCDVLYKPYTSVPTKTATAEQLLATVQVNFEIASGFLNVPYSFDDLNIFRTQILNVHNPRGETHVPITFIYRDAEGQPEKLYRDIFSGPSVQFFTDVIKELLDHKVFIPTKTLFNNERYELNKGFDVSTLECYKILPEEMKTPTFKNEITEYFFLFVGNLIHFAVVNNIELPFKLSRVYIMKLFGLFEFVKDATDRDTQILLITVYLLEKAPSTFTKAIIKVFEDPENLLSEDVMQVLDPDLLDEKDEQIIKKGVRMNGTYTITNSNKHIHSEDSKTLVDNVIEYLYKIALKHYFGNINTETVFDKMNPYLELFFDGFKFVKKFGRPDDTKVAMGVLNFYNDPFSEKLNIIRKADLFLSGFGFTDEDIKKHLIPNIKMDIVLNNGKEEEMSPLLFFNDNGVFRDSYIPNTSLNSSMSAALNSKISRILNENSREQVKFAFLLYKVLLNKGKDISKIFISEYNFKFYNIPIPTPAEIANTQNYGKLTDEDYHNEFVKYLIKAWTGSPSLSSNSIYKVDYNRNTFNNDPNHKPIPTAYTCFNKLYIKRDYENDAQELYNSLVSFVIGTNFGQALTGGKSSRKKR
jgi:hypothetical protein